MTRVLARNLNVPYDVDAALWRILDNLRMNVAGGVIIKDSFLVLIYPAGMEGWNFLDTGGGGAQSSSGTKLKCQIFRLDPAYFNLIKEDNVKILRSRTERQPSPSLSYNHHLPNVFKHLFGIEMKNLLPKATRDKSVDNFFLIFPSAISEERKLYVDLLTKSGAKVILHEDPPDTAWQYFRSHYDHGVVLVSRQSVRSKKSSSPFPPLLIPTSNDYIPLFFFPNPKSRLYISNLIPTSTNPDPSLLHIHPPNPQTRPTNAQELHHLRIRHQHRSHHDHAHRIHMHPTISSRRRGVDNRRTDHGSTDRRIHLRQLVRQNAEMSSAQHLETCGSSRSQRLGIIHCECERQRRNQSQGRQ